MKTAIIIAGKKQSGKDTLANYFIRDGYTRYAFADYLKASLKGFLQAQFYTTIDVEDFSNNRKKENYKLRFPFCENEHSLRDLMQWYGEMIKDKFGKFFWIKNLAYNAISNQSELIVISDCRFDYEFTEIQKLLPDFTFHSFYVERKSKATDDTHISENCLDDKKDLFDFVITNDQEVKQFKMEYERIRDYLASC